MANGYNPSAIRIQRMLGASKPPRMPTLPKPMATPKFGAGVSDRMLMRPGRAEGGETGGGIEDSPESPFTGGIMSAGAGRADDVPMHVPDGSYVVPAWAVSHLGEGNTVSGMSQLKMMFGSPWGAPKAPWGAPSPALKVGKGIKIPRGKPPPMHFTPPNFYPQGMSEENPALTDKQKHGGAATNLPTRNGAVPINASGGEFVISPSEVAKMGDGNVDKGHLILDRWVLTLKKEAADTIKRLPGPAK
jgi:hypothetical protein